MTELKETQIDLELQGRVLDAMFVFSDLGDGTIKCTIPDQIFNGDEKIKINEKEYGIYDVPGVNRINASTKIIERANEKFISGHGAPSWSQIVTAELQDQTFNQLVQYPKTVYLRK